MTFFLVSSHLSSTRLLFKIASIKLRIVGTSSISHYSVTIACEIEDPPAAFLSIASSVRSFLHVPRFLASRWRGKYYSVDERRWRSGGEGRGGGVEKWRERTKEKGTLDSFGARNLAQLENEWHFNPRPRTRGQATRWKRRRHRCLHCKMIQRRRTKKQKERNTEGIGSECWKRARGTGDGSKDSVQIVKGRTETERVGERANTSVACLFKHVPVPWFLFQPLAPTYPLPPFLPLRVERASTRDQVESDTPASLHNTYTAHRELPWTYAKPVRVFLALWYIGDQPTQKSDTAVRFGAGESATSGRSFVRNFRGKRGLE